MDTDARFTTPEAARMLGLSESRIRQLELAGTIPPAQRAARFRIYTAAEVERIRRILDERRAARYAKREAD